jgi:HD superfamily phosphohydrolase
VARKGLAAIEHYLVVRSFMYSQVYNHPKNIAANWVLEQIAARARSLPAAAIFLDATMADWLTGPVDALPLDRYLAMDDTVCFYHLERWRQAARMRPWRILSPLPGPRFTQGAWDRVICRSSSGNSWRTATSW